MQNGIENKTKEVVKKLLERKMPIEEIQEITQLSKDKIKKLEEEL